MTDASEPESPTFTCTLCGRTYAKAWSDAEAAAEQRLLWGEVPCAIVCDDCYRRALPVSDASTSVDDAALEVARLAFAFMQSRVATLEAAAAVVLEEMGRVGGADSQRLNTALRIMRVGPENVHWCAVCQHGQGEHMHLDGSCAVWQCACSGFQPVTR